MPLDYIKIKEAVESNRFDWERAGLPYAIKNMTRQQRIYKVLKKYLTEIDRWKNLKRGKPNPNYAWRRDV